MKNSLFFIVSFLFGFSSVNAQIKNPGFEISGLRANLPTDWSYTEKKGYLIGLDSIEKRQGKFSFKIHGTDSLAKEFQGISQQINMQSDQLRYVNLDVYIRSKDVKGYVATWCQIWNTKQNKMVGFENIVTQQSRITGTNDWKPYHLSLVLEKGADQLVFGGYLMGSDTVYFDEFNLDVRGNLNHAPADAVRRYIDLFRNIVKENSLYADSLDWKTIDHDVASLSMGMEKLEDAPVISRYILKKLRAAGDNHSFLQPKSAARAYASGNTLTQKVNSDLLENNIGYISVPAFGSTDQKTMGAFANDIQERIRNLDSQHEIKGWIVDLRSNGGGNMHPMIAGLGPLTGEGILGYFMYRSGEGKKYIPWTYKASKNNKKATLGVNLTNPYHLRNKQVPVAVLMGPGTGSSGEMTALTFRGKSGARLFGQPSAGYTSANQSYPLIDGSMLLLATSYATDRNKMEVKSKIQPDELINTDVNTDATLKAAIRWLKGID